MDTLGHPTLWIPAHEDIHLGAHYVYREGWRANLYMRRCGQTHLEATRNGYELLTTPELLDVVCCELAQQLGLSGSS